MISITCQEFLQVDQHSLNQCKSLWKWESRIDVFEEDLNLKRVIEKHISHLISVQYIPHTRCRNSSLKIGLLADTINLVCFKKDVRLVAATFARKTIMTLLTPNLLLARFSWIKILCFPLNPNCTSQVMYIMSAGSWGHDMGKRSSFFPGCSWAISSRERQSLETRGEEV